MTWIGSTSGLDAAKAGAVLLGKSGRIWYETTSAVEPHQWIFNESQPGTAGPVRVVGAQYPLAVGERPLKERDHLGRPLRSPVGRR